MIGTAVKHRQSGADGTIVTGPFDSIGLGDLSGLWVRVVFIGEGFSCWCPVGSLVLLVV